MTLDELYNEYLAAWSLSAWSQIDDPRTLEERQAEECSFLASDYDELQTCGCKRLNPTCWHYHIASKAHCRTQVAAKAYVLACEELTRTGCEKQAVQAAMLWKLANGGAQ